jgi:hypothetical protein
VRLLRDFVAAAHLRERRVAKKKASARESAGLNVVSSSDAKSGPPGVLKRASASRSSGTWKDWLEFKNPAAPGGEARGGGGLGQGALAMTKEQLVRWLYVLLAAMAGGTAGLLLLWWLG